MVRPKASPLATRELRALSIQQLEVGLRTLDDCNSNRTAFWDENIHSFRRTVLFAIRDTSDALLSATIPLEWRIELENQLEELVQYIELADRYIARRFLSRAPVALRPAAARLH